MDEEPIIKRKTSLKRSQGGLFSTKKPKKASIDIPAEQSQSPRISSPLTPEPLGDQDGLTLDLLEVKVTLSASFKLNFSAAHFSI